MGMFVFLLVCLFWTGVLSLAATPAGTVLVLLVAAPLGLLLAMLRLPADLIAILFVALFAVPALYNLVSGVRRAIRGSPDAWWSWSWAVSFAAIPWVVHRAFETMSGGFH